MIEMNHTILYKIRLGIAGFLLLSEELFKIPQKTFYYI